jgi:APA family basic amino acid/polyamine antiporter
VGLFVLRYRKPDAARPYRVTGYPYVPAIFVVFTLVFLVLTLAGDVADYRNGQSPLIDSLLGILITALGFVLYLGGRKKTG